MSTLPPGQVPRPVFPRFGLPRFAQRRPGDPPSISLPIADLLVPAVLLADRLGGEPLSFARGAPLRLVAPAHYGAGCISR